MDLFLENLSNPAYKEATQFLYNLQYSGIKLGLKNILAFMDHLGNPQKKLKTIHLAGTNGKGSTAAILESILIKAGYTVGCYTSPHLISFQERIRIDRKLINTEYINHFINTHKKVIADLNLTFFEATTGMAFQYFAEKNPDVIIVESGLGGRLDSTNIIESPLTLITKIDLDHQPYLGDTIEKISHEKAGIIFKNSDVFTSNRNSTAINIIEEKAKDTGATFNNIHDLASTNLVKISPRGMVFNYFSEKVNLKKLYMPLTGIHQIENAKLAITALLYNKTYSVEIKHIMDGLATVLWPGRLQLLHSKPSLLLDAGHNPDGFRNSLKTVKKVNKGRLLTVCGIVDDKNSKEIAELVEDFSDEIYLTNFESRRLLSPDKFVKFFSQPQNIKLFNRSCYSETENLIKNINENDTILIIGSHYLIGEFLHEWIKTKKGFAYYYQTP